MHLSPADRSCVRASYLERHRWIRTVTMKPVVKFCDRPAHVHHGLGGFLAALLVMLTVLRTSPTLGTYPPLAFAPTCVTWRAVEIVTIGTGDKGEPSLTGEAGEQRSMGETGSSLTSCRRHCRAQLVRGWEIGDYCEITKTI